MTLVIEARRKDWNSQYFEYDTELHAFEVTCQYGVLWLEFASLANPSRKMSSGPYDALTVRLDVPSWANVYRVRLTEEPTPSQPNTGGARG